MKDTQVERLVGLPKEIFRGFNKIEYGNIVTRGQLNYTCWMFPQIKTMIFDTITEMIINKSFIGIPDTSVYFNDTIKVFLDSPQSSYTIGDTIFFFNNYMPSRETYCFSCTDNPSYHFVQIQKRSLHIDTIKDLTYDTTYITLQRYIILRQCVLFDPSSNRVVDVDYYPFSINKKLIINK
jgi:hypothetical protein